MKFMQVHIGDWITATTSLDTASEALYLRLCLWMFGHERRLPLSMKQLRVLSRCRTAHDAESLALVLDMHFVITETGFTNRKVEELFRKAGRVLRNAPVPSRSGPSSVTRYVTHNEGETDESDVRDALRDAALRTGNAARQRAYRERQKAKLKALTDAADPPMRNGSTHELVPLPEEPAHNASSNALRNASHHDHARGIQEPVTDKALPTGRAVPAPAPARVEGSPSPAGLACRAMRAAGIADVNPSHPDLLRLLDAGVTAVELGDAADELVKRGKGTFAYTLATVSGRRRDAAAADPVQAKTDRLEQWAGPVLTARMRGGA